MEAPHSIFKSIWLVDDDEDDHFVFENALREVLPAATVRHFYSANDLLAELEMEQPDLLFLDINLPRLDGKTCLKLIRERRDLLHLPIVIYSGSIYPLDINVSYGFGATLYLVKPSSPDRLTNMLQKIMLLDWNDPKEITNSHFTGDKFVPFSAE
jgi:CheY-like chemotaxis protein